MKLMTIGREQAMLVTSHVNEALKSVQGTYPGAALIQVKRETPFPKWQL